MKSFNQFFLTAMLLALPFFLIAQSDAQKKQVCLDKASISAEWLDPYYPNPNSPEGMVNYSAAIEQYAKEHPAFPVLILENPSPEQIEQYNVLVENWVQQFGMYFPAFIEYSKFNHTLTSQDDYSIYFAAREEWARRYPVKASLLEEEIGLWINTHPKEYDVLKNSSNNKEVR